MADALPRINADIEGYAVKLICDGAESTIEDDLDEDGALPDETQLNQAHELAMQIVRWIRDHPDDLVRRARGYAASTIRHNRPESEPQ